MDPYSPIQKLYCWARQCPWDAGVWAAIGLVGFVFTVAPALDLALTGLFYDGGFDLARVDGLEVLRDTLWRLTLIMFFLSAGAWIWLGRGRQLWSVPRVVWGHIAALYLLGPALLVNLILKEYWGRARPAQVTEFGGDALFTTPFDATDQCARNCSFVSGEASGGAVLAIAVWYLSSYVPSRPLRWTLRAAALVGALVMAGLRVAKGRHFTSDVLLAGLFMMAIAVGLGLWTGVRGRPNPFHLDTATRQRLATIPAAPARRRAPGLALHTLPTPAYKQGMTAITIVIPALNEAESLRPLLQRIDAALAPRKDFEIVVVDDASTDGTAASLEPMEPHWRVMRHMQTAGQSAGVHTGVQAARGGIIVTLDADGQNPPEEIPKLVAAMEAASPEVGLVAGQRVDRQDTVSKKWASRAANALRSRLLGDATRDTGCGLKAFRRDAFLALPFFNHMHRYLPALFSRADWVVTHVDVAHAARTGGSSKYSNLQRALVGAVDLFGVYWLIKRRKITTASELPPAPKAP